MEETIKAQVYNDKFNCVHDNPYKTYCTMIPVAWSNPTGRTLSMLPFGINHNDTIRRYSTNSIFPVKENRFNHHMYPNSQGKYMVPQTVDPRPAVRIGYEYRNS